jgi:hypothetical protein
MDKDWDNLIILDACRYDTFDKYNSISGDLGSEISQASHSLGFVMKNFNNKKLHDTIYITPNVHISYVDDDIFYKVIPTFGDNVQSPKHKDNRSPEAVCEAAINAHEQYPNKRLIIHFMQPHSPHFSHHAECLRETLRQKEDLSFSTWGDESSENTTSIKDLNEAANRGYISKNMLENIYSENLEFVLNHVDELLQKIDGKSVITSDHGECLGESELFLFPDLYDHETNIYMKELRKVPWLEVIDDRREIRKDVPEEDEKLTEKQVKEQLKSLGYIDDW